MANRVLLRFDGFLKENIVCVEIAILQVDFVRLCLPFAEKTSNKVR